MPPDWPAAGARYLRVLAHTPGEGHLRFWRASLRMPAGVFALLVNILLTPGKWKQWLARLRGAA